MRIVHNQRKLTPTNFKAVKKLDNGILAIPRICWLCACSSACVREERGREEMGQDGAPTPNTRKLKRQHRRWGNSTHTRKLQAVTPSVGRQHAHPLEEVAIRQHLQFLQDEEDAPLHEEILVCVEALAQLAEIAQTHSLRAARSVSRQSVTAARDCILTGTGMWHHPKVESLPPPTLIPRNTRRR